ncbi:MAG: ParB N-terminal domain-containing protein [Nitrosomonas sp.]|nr:ParB N-terminal domain-containing protein [Nitrosomonas sp.]
MKTKIIKLSDIVIDAGTQQREKINDEIVAEYAEAMKCGTKFPAMTVFFNGAEYYLVDGFHRYWAHKDAGIEDITADVHEGSKREARLFSAGVNNAHGIRLTNQDKRKAVLVLIEDDEWSEWSDNQIAKHCKVTQPFVSKIRKEVITVITPINSNDNNSELPTVGKTEPKPAPILETENDETEEYDEESIRAEMDSEFDPVAELETTHKEIDRLTKVIESDDQLAAAMAENKRLTELCRVLEERMRGFQSSENAAKQAAKMWKNKFEKLEKQMKASGLVEF